MKKMKDLLKEQSSLIDELQMLKIKVQKKTQDASALANKIGELKEKEDFGSFRFVQTNMQEIIRTIAPKHKIPKDREINLTSSGDTNMVVSIPWGEEDCSDNDPCNVNICPRCTLIHFNRLLDRLLAGYYSQ